MADIWGTIEANKKFIILAGFLVGVAYIMEFLPKDISLFATYTSYVYVGVIIFSAYVFFKYHWNPKAAPTDVQRNMSDPRFLRTNPGMRQPVPSVRHQHAQAPGAYRPPVDPAMQGRPANEIYDKFKND